jgi:hypothetical protein
MTKRHIAHSTAYTDITGHTLDIVPVRIGKTHLWSEVGSKKRGTPKEWAVFSTALKVCGERLPSTTIRWLSLMSCVCCCTVCGESSWITRTSATARARVPVVSCMAV